MVRGVDSGGMEAELFIPDEGDGGEAEKEQRACPEVGDEVLLAAGLVPETAEERDAAEEGGGGGDEGDKDEVGEPTEEGRGDGGGR